MIVLTNMDKFAIYNNGNARYTEAAPYGVCRVRQGR